MFCDIYLSEWIWRKKVSAQLFVIFNTMPVWQTMARTRSLKASTQHKGSNKICSPAVLWEISRPLQADSIFTDLSLTVTGVSGWTQQHDSGDRSANNDPLLKVTSGTEQTEIYKHNVERSEKTQNNLSEDEWGDLSRQGLMREWATGETGMRTRWRERGIE